MTLRRLAWVSLAIVGLALSAFALFFAGPRLLVDDDGGLSSPDRLDSEAAARTALVGAVVAAGAAVTSAVALGNLRATRETNTVDRYVTAVEQLASKSTHVRVGGVYALQSVGRSSSEHREAVVGVLATFVRTTGRDEDVPEFSGNGVGDDVQVAVMALASLHEEAGLPPLNLRGSTLVRLMAPGVHLADVRLAGSNLRRANLCGADLRAGRLVGVNLEEALLERADCRGADLSHSSSGRSYLAGCNLSDARLEGSRLDHAWLTGAQMTRASLRGADCTGSRFDGADLVAADLTDADLRGAYLVGANLSGAVLRRARLAGARVRSGQLTDEQLAEALDGDRVVLIDVDQAVI